MAVIPRRREPFVGGVRVLRNALAHEELRRDMDAAGRRKLLRLLDAQNALLVEATLMSFTAGFKLAAGIAGELGTPYSFDADEEQKAKEMITNG